MIFEIAIGIGEVLEANNTNNNLKNLGFCLALDSHASLEPLVTIINKFTQSKSIILIDYNFLFIHCKFYFNTIHYIKKFLVRLEALQLII